MGLKDLVGSAIGKAVQGGLWALELGAEIFDRPFVQPAEDGQLLVDEGPDDLFAEDDYVTARLNVDLPDPEPELIVGQQWGLQLPNGEVHWNTWQGSLFGHPVDRASFVANLQKTAEDIGLPGGQQTDELLDKYRWVTRNQIATVVYEETGAYPLTDPRVFVLGTPESDESPHDDHENFTNVDYAVNGQDPHASVCPRPLGGDAQ